MRYFLISYHSDSQGRIGQGFLTMKKHKFPSFLEMELLVIERAKDVYSVVITNIFEFKNKEDFENFVEK